MYAASVLPSCRQRRQAALTVLVALGVGMFVIRLPVFAMRMGDYENYTFSKEHFELYMSLEDIQFQAHLSTVVLAGLHALFGASRQSAVAAFEWFAAMTSVAFVASLFGAGILLGWTPAALRYLALTISLPATVLFFGYREVGHVPLAFAALVLPLAARSLLRESRSGLAVAGALAGLSAAFHGFGLITMLTVLAAVMFDASPLRVRVERMTYVTVAGIAAWVGWIPIYVIAMKSNIVPGHTESLPFRSLFSSRVEFFGRINEPLFSGAVLEELALMCWMVGLPLAVAALHARRHPVGRRMLIAAVPALVFAMTFWPVLGIANDTDLVMAAFPAAYLLAWIVAASPVATAFGLFLVANCHIGFWLVVSDEALVRHG